ncbi:MAG: nuclear transport factor 2 family protein [Dehalococcoidales bacterium]
MKFKTLWLLLPLLVVAIIPMAGCGGNPTLDVVNKFIAAEDLMFSTGDGSGLMAVEDTNLVLHMMAWPDTKGNAAHVAAIKGIVAGASAPITHVWSEITATGDIGSVRWVETDKIGGKDVSYQGAYFLKVKDGKIVEAWLVSDMLTYFLAAGIVQYAPTPSK